MTHSLRLVARGLTSALISLALIAPASAALFTDVPDGSLYQGAVEGLTLQGIVNGYADGTYGPRKPVNRAEFLQLLFRAARLQQSNDRLCFADVPNNAWFEAAVCTAKSLGIVGGYPDGTFKPSQQVTRGEAMKMLSLAFQLPSAASVSVGQYTDVPLDRWDAPFISLLVERGVLPLTGQESTTAFHSEWALTRGDAALLLWGTLQSLQRLPLSSSSSDVSVSSESSDASSSSSEESSVSSAPSSTSSSSRSSRSSSSSAASSTSSATIATVVVPFTKEGSATRRSPALYRFTLDAKKTVAFDVKKIGDAVEVPTCRLFRLRDDGISNEYYFGTKSAGSCLLKVALGAGDYQLEVTARDATSFSVTATEAKSDGNDGFGEAATLRFSGTGIRGSIGNTDYGQYYVFKVAEEKKMTVALVSDDALECLIFPGDDVELASFEGPICNHPYQFTKGTYTVWIGHDPIGVTRSTFSLRLE